MGDIAISVRGVSKRYKIFENQRSRFLHALWPRYQGGKRDVWALDDVSFEIQRGEAVAIIGRNGGGKSTLLQILSGTLTPTSGEVEVRGRVSALLELGSGFNPEYTGRDNVILNGLLFGLTRAQILRRFDEIAAFAEIGDVLDRPVKTYSSGMIMRLAFAVQVLAEPDILIIDEALSVGDFFFQQKCLGYIRSLADKGVTLLFVSHDMGTVRDICSRTIYIKEGKVQFIGDTQRAIRHYLSERGAAGPAGAFAEETAVEKAATLDSILRDSVWRAPSAEQQQLPGRLVAVAFYNGEGQPATVFRLGARLCIKVAFVPAADKPTHVSVELKNKFNQVVTSVGSSRLGLEPPRPRQGQPLIFEMKIDLQLEAGNYSVAVNLGHLVGPNRGENLDSTALIGPITIQWDYEQDPSPFLGMVGLPIEGEFKTVQVEVAV